MSDELDDVIREFIIESYESLDELDRELVTLEQSANADLLARIFRAIHTVKGTSGFLGFGKLESITHVGESLLSKLRDGVLEVNEPITTALLAMVDAVRAIIERIEATGEEGDADFDDLVAELGRLHDGDTSPAAAAPASPEPPAAAAPEPTVADAPAPPEPEHPVEPIDATREESTAPAAAEPEQPARKPSRRTSTATATKSVAKRPATKRSPAKKAPRTAPASPAPDVEPPVEAVAADHDDAVQAGGNSDGRHPTGGESIRVDVGLLDDLMNLVGELVLARNQIIQHTSSESDAAFTATTQRLNLITTELQEGVMRTRMQPIENVWNKFPRVVRDLTRACGKQARLEMEGKHTELDKTLLEAIKDPLTHLVRNSVDHGLELPDQRLAAGKPAEGAVRLGAYHEGGQVIIEITDDGRGIDPAVLRQKAIDKGLLTAEEAAARSDRAIVDMIFQAGFSTAEAVTNISGRGVGMDVVRTNIESIGGSVDVQSTPGVGTTFKVKIPLTLAIIPALIVTSGSDRYAIPQVSLVELVHADLSAENGLEHVNGAPVFRLRNNLLPLVYLSEVLEEERSGDDSLNIAVLQADDRRFGLVVDQITDTAEIVVKPLGRLLKHAVAFSGATIMGDGRVALILDVLGLAQRAEVGSAAIQRAQFDMIDQAPTSADGITEPMLLVGIGERRFVLPLETVSRLEELPTSSVRNAGDREVIHYRGEILPLVDLGRQLGVLASPREESLSVLVCTTAAGGLGLIVDQIHDIADQRLDVSDRTARYGIRGTTVIRDEVTDVLDLEALVAEHRSTTQGF